MKVLIIIVVLSCLHLSTRAQKNEDVKAFLTRLGTQSGDTGFWNTVTIEQVLGLPNAYTVEYCSLDYISKGEIFRCYYSDKLRPPCVGWTLNMIASKAEKGDELLIDDILVKKGDKRIKLIEKTIVVK